MNTDIHFATGKCSLGTVLVAQSLRGVCAILLGDDKAALLSELETRFPLSNRINDAAACKPALTSITALIAAPATKCKMPLDMRGTAFQQRVWKALQKIPAGKTCSYSDIAQRIGAPTASRAVAQACAANALAVVIPCHRVVRSDGGLSGYRWGVERKRVLLEREAQSH